MSTRFRNLLLTTTALLTLGSTPGAAGPDGPTVVGGSATITGAGTSSVLVKQTTDRAIINWNTFNIRTGESTTFQQINTSSIALNRVTGNLGPSVIDGTLTANGRVFVINRDGILIGPNGVINTAGFLATTHDIKNADFMAGRMNFNIPGRPDASVVNEGRITATTGGFAALVAPGVRNSGTITATLGTVSLASGNMFTLDMYGDKLIQLGVGDQIASQVHDVATGQPLKSLVTNEGKIKANGGRVELTAAAARVVVDSVINNRGVIEANSIGTKGGRIVLGAATSATKPAGAPRQTVRISGTMTAAGKKQDTKGGTIVVTGEDIQVAGATIDASGQVGGGKLLLGGDWAGGKPTAGVVDHPSAKLEGFAVPRATTLSVDAATTIDASAKTTGNGGKVILWSDSVTSFAGTIYARGGLVSGDGGFVEVSSHGQLNYAGSVDTLAPAGKAGTLLLDPADYYIVTTLGGSPTGASEITNTALQNQLATSNVTIATNNNANPSGQHGDIFVNAAVTWSVPTTLTLSAFRNINLPDLFIGPNLKNTGAGSIMLRADSTGTGMGTIIMPGGTSANRLDWSGSTGTVSVYYDPTAYTSPTDFTTGNGRFVLASPSQLTPYMLVNNVSDLQLVSSNLGGTYALGKDLDAGATASGAGFTPIGSQFNRFVGLFDGQNHTIDGLTIKTFTAGGVAGLFGGIGAGAIVRNVGLANENVSLTLPDNSMGWVGTLVGLNEGGTITNTHASGLVSVTVPGTTGIYQVGGLVGFNAGQIANSYSSATEIANGGQFMRIGGLVGVNGSITDNNSQFVGSIINSYATGAVTGGLAGVVGGLVGANGTTITNSYATGIVTGPRQNTGGLVGSGSGLVINSFWDTQTTGQMNSAGGTAGTTSALQTSLPSGWDTAYGIVPGTSYPYLKWQFAAGQTPMVVSGTAFSVYDKTPAAGTIVSGLLDGTPLASVLTGGAVTTGANGYYYFLLAPGTISPPAGQLLTYTTGATGGAAFQHNGSGSVVGLDIYGTYLKDTSGATTLSAIDAGRVIAIGGNTGVQTLVNGLPNRQIDLQSATFAIDHSVSTGTIVLSSAGAVTQLVPIAATNVALLGVGGSYALTNTGNQIGTLAANVGPSGSVSITNAANLAIGTVAGTAGVNAGTLTILDTGLVTQSAPIAATNLALLGSGGSYTLTNSANQIGTLVANVGPAGSVSVADSSNLAIGTVGITAGVNAGTLVISDTGAVAQSAAITAASLALLGSGGSYTLTNSTNQIGTIAANVGPAGSVSVTDNANLAIGTVGSATGVNGATFVISDTGAVTQTAPITVTNLALLGVGGSYALTNTGNQIGTLAVNVGPSGSVSVTNAANLAIGTVAGTAGVNAGTLTILDTGAVTQSAAIAVTNLALLGSGGNYMLTNIGNQVGTLATNVGPSGSVNIANAANLAIGTVAGTTGVNAGTLTILDTGAVTQSAPITATNLALLGGGGSYTLTNAANRIGTLAANTGAVNITDAANLMIGTVGGTSGVTTSGAFTLKGMGTNITATAGVDVGTFTLTGGNWNQNSATLPTFNAADFRIAGGSFLRVTGGDGSVANPYSIADVYGLQGIGSDGVFLAKNFVLAKDVDAGGSAAWNSGAGFQPLGALGTGTFTFTGSLDGHNHAIDHLTLSSASTLVGLFPIIGSGGEVRNLNLTNVSVTATGSAQIVGTLAGQSAGNIADVQITGAVTSTDSGGPLSSSVGGLIGYNLDGGKVSRSSASTTVTGGSLTLVGGLVAFNFAGGVIIDSYASGKVTGVGGTGGGLVGENDGNITNSYASGTVNGSWILGGLVGGNEGTIADSYATGIVRGADSDSRFFSNPATGGLVGQNDGTITRSHASGAVNGGIDNNVGGLVGSNLGKITQSYSSGSLIASKANSAEHNQFVGGLVGFNWFNGTITESHASGNISVSYGGYIGGLAGRNDGIIQSSFFEIGTVTDTDTGAATTATIGGLVGQNGNFGSGPGKIIDSYATGSVNFSGNSFVAAGGLVGSNAGSIAASYATGTVNGTALISRVGGLVGDNGGTITNSYATGAVAANVTVGENSFGTNQVGGLVGFNQGQISNSYATGAVNAAVAGQGFFDVEVGGLVGSNGGAITKSYATGAVTGSSSAHVGGLVGSNTGTVSLSNAAGNVIGGDGSYVGGFVGLNSGTIDQAFATGSSRGGVGTFVGGFVGTNEGSNSPVPGIPSVTATISNSYATGNVTGDTGSVAGGFFGVNLFGSVDHSYATGAVSGGAGSAVGGFVGLNLGTVNVAFATGPVSGGDNSFVGGFVGVNFAVADSRGGTLAGTGAISQAYALGSATGGKNSFVGGFAAINVGSLDQTYAAGLVTGGAGSTLGGLVASNTFSYTLPDAIALLDPPGTATNSYWDRQTTGQTASAGGTALDTSQLVAGLPAGFDPAVWGANAGSYPFLLAQPASTTPGAPVLPPAPEPPAPTPEPLPPPVESLPPTVQPPATQQQVADLTRAPTILAAASPAAVVNTEAVTQQQTAGQRSTQQRPGAVAPDQPIRLDAGAGRYFYLPPPGETRLVRNEVVLALPCDVSQPQLDTVTRRLGLTVLGSQCLGTGTTGTAVYRMQIGGGQTPSGVIRALVANRIVAAAQANYLYALAQDAPSAEPQGDPGQYVIEKLHLGDLHRLVKGTNVSIAVIDSEIDGAHPDLAGTIANRFDATGTDEKPHPHGTGMAGAIGSHQRLMGIAPSARLVAIRAFSSTTAKAESTTFNIIKGLNFAVNSGVRIVNMSFAGPKDPSLERELAAAYDKGVVLIAAAGNAGPKSPPLYPAADKSVIAVTATDMDDKLFAGANRGRYISIAAPGVDILVPAPENSYQLTTGTSVATAHISGIVALMLERNPRLTPAEVRGILIRSAKRLGPNTDFGSGLVDPVKALELAAPKSAALGATTRQ